MQLAQIIISILPIKVYEPETGVAVVKNYSLNSFHYRALSIMYKIHQTVQNYVW